MNIELERINLYDQDELNGIISLIYSDEELKDTFGGNNNTRRRLINATYAAYIKKVNEKIGFVVLVDNRGKYEVDMGILKNYRGKGYGTEALGLLKELIVKNNLDVEVQVSNVNLSAIRTVLKNGFELTRSDEFYNYYGISNKKR